MSAWSLSRALGFALLVAANVECSRASTPEEVLVSGGHEGRGVAVIQEKGCGACHTIPRIKAASGTVGPPLTSFARRSFIAGNLPNTPEHLVRWIMDPQAVEPGTAMPNLDVTEQEARDIAAFLYTLQ